MEYAMRDTLGNYERAKKFHERWGLMQLWYLVRAPFEYFKAIKAVEPYLAWLSLPDRDEDGHSYIKYRAWIDRGQWFDITFDDALHCVKLTASTGRVYFL